MHPFLITATNSFQWENEAFDNEDNIRLVDSIEMNTKHYVEIFSRAVDKVMPAASEDIS
jgi:DNA replication licensing factor MCM7